MAWLRVDDRVRTHPKIVSAGPAAAWFWFCGVCYCREHLTDGFIPDKMLPSLAPGVTNGKTLAAKLVAANLWHKVEGGYQVHDFLDWNPSRADVEASREQDRRRKAKGIQTESEMESGRNPDGIRTESDRSPDGFPTDSSRVRAIARGLGSGFLDGSTSEGGVGETAAPIPKPRHAPGPLAGALPRDHIEHAWCGARFCVNAKQFKELARRYGAGGEAAIKGWLDELHGRLGPDDSPGGPVWVLQHFDAWLVQQGRMKPAPRPVATPTHSAVPSAEETRRITEAARRRVQS